MNTSAPPASRSTISRPCSCPRSTASERLPAFEARNSAPSPSTNGGPQARAWSPAGGSTLTTSEPSAASNCVAVGPASEEVRSTTRVPARGRSCVTFADPRPRRESAGAARGGRVGSQGEHDRPFELDHGLLALVEAARADGDDAGLWTGARLALGEHLCLRADRVAGEDGSRQADLAPAEVH